MKKTKVEKGITLIALIITIVVLLILAVVSIGAIRESSIITQAQNASDNWNKGTIQEELNLKSTELKIGIVENPSAYKIKVYEIDEKNLRDNGEINKILSEMGLKINDDQLNDEGQLIINLDYLWKNTIDEECYEERYRYYVKGKDENGKNVIILIEFIPEMPDSYDENSEEFILAQIREIRLWGELGSTIYDINNDMNTERNYRKYSIIFDKENESSEEFFKRFFDEIVYQTLINNGIKIESTELLNDEENGFKDFLILIEEGYIFELENDVLGRGEVGMNIKCSKGGEEFSFLVPISFDVDYYNGVTETELELLELMVDTNHNYLIDRILE